MWMLNKGLVAGTICIFYDHTHEPSEHEIIDVQHKFMDIIRASTHLHIDQNRCFEVLLVLGDVSRVKELAKRLASIKVVKSIKYCIVPI